MDDDVGGVQSGLKHVHSGDALVKLTDDGAQLLGVLGGERGDGLGLAAGHTDEDGGIGTNAAREHIALQLADGDVGGAAFLGHHSAQDNGPAAAGGEQNGLSIPQVGHDSFGQCLMAGGEGGDKNDLRTGDSLFEIMGQLGNLSKAGGSQAGQFKPAASSDGGQVFLAPALLFTQRYPIAHQR